MTADYAPEVVADARAWAEDVVANPEAVEDATDAEVMRFVALTYCGGVAAFLQDSAPAGGVVG
jgi:hypothetical protein